VKPYPRYLDWLRYISALLLYFYGISKLTGHQLVVPSWVAQKSIGSLDGYTLTWYYFGYSHTYKYILGLIQVTCASLLLFRKSALIAAVMMVPMMVNIMLINIFYSITAGAERMAAFILGCMLLLLWHERKALSETLWTSQSTESSSAQKRHWVIRGLVLFFVLGQVLLGTVMAHQPGHFYSLPKGH
jgi:hypothetical protein